jgi:peptidoglycan/LPS O-acetylase OafA/YrhL
VGAMALFLATLRPQTNSVPSRLAQVFIYLGNISFGLYVFHVLGLMISDYTVSHQDSSLGRYLFHNLVAFAVTVVLASISYRWLEKPFLGLKKRFSRVASRPA